MTVEADARRTVVAGIFGTLATQAIGAAARLDLADRIGDGEAASVELAAACGLPPEQLERLLRSLASLGLCAEPTPRPFTLTQAGGQHRRDHPASQLAV
ncbi:methyltransferase, partial [Streptomyces sp. NPDC059578]